MEFATILDFEVRHGPQLEDDEERIEALLDDAAGLIEAEIEGAEAPWLEEETKESVPAVVKAICVQVAYRAWSNPDGVAREELGSVARTYRGTNQADALWLTKNEARMVRRAAKIGAVRSVQVETPYSGEPEEASSLDFLPLSGS